MLEDRVGQTPFAVALDTKDHKSAEAILSREPLAAEKVNLFFKAPKFVFFCCFFHITRLQIDR